MGIPMHGRKRSSAKYRRGTFYGMEHVQDTHRLALMNLMLHGLEFKLRRGRNSLWGYALP